MLSFYLAKVKKRKVGMDMKIYYKKLQVLENSVHYVDFILDEKTYRLDLNEINDTEKACFVDSFNLANQVLFTFEQDNATIVVFIKSDNIFATKVNYIPKNQFYISETSYEIRLDNFSNLLSFEQTGDTTFSIFDYKGNYLFSIHDIATHDFEKYTHSIDLEISTVELRFMPLGKITYSTYYIFVMYDLFKKELFTKKVIFEIDFKIEDLDCQLITPNSVEITLETYTSSIKISNILSKGLNLFDIYKSEKYRNYHVLGILKINGTKYYIHNKLNGVFITQGNPSKISGFYPNMKLRFIGTNLYIFGRNTHYAYEANERYEYLYISKKEEPIAKFVRPIKFRFLRRFGFFKVPITVLSGEVNNTSRSLFLGNKNRVLHILKLKAVPQKSKILDFKIGNDQVNLIKTSAKGNVTSTIITKTNEFTKFKRNFIFLMNLKKSTILLKLFRIIFIVMGWLPKKRNLIIFESFHAKQYSDNPRAIYEYMKINYPGYELLWSVDKQRVQLFEDFNVSYITRFSLRWFLTFPRAKYWVNNVRLPGWMPKPRGTVYLQTWHGTPLKKLGLDIEELHMPGTKTETYKRNFVNESKNWDFLISPNAYSSTIFKRAFHFKGEVIESGYPRNDVLSSPSKNVMREIKEKLGIPTSKKIMLYAPTWRDNEFYEKGKYKFSFQFDLDKWKTEFGSEWVLLTRMHYLVAENFDFSTYEGAVFDVSAYADIRDLYLISDLLITDYSSVFFDYSALKRPIVFFMYDLETYRDQLRGFYIDIEHDAPGPIVQTEEELFNAIEDLIQSNVHTNPKYNAFSNKFTSLEDGHATERVVKAFLKQ